MDLSHIEHLGIAVKSIQEALPFFEETLGLKCYNIEEVADQKVRTAFLKIGETKLEERRGDSSHRFCYARCRRCPLRSQRKRGATYRQTTPPGGRGA